MAASDRPPHQPGHSGKFSDKTVLQNDEDGLMKRIWSLKNKKEELEEEIKAATAEVDGWLQVLSCSSVTELDELMDEFSANPAVMPSCSLLTSPSDLELLTKYSELVSQLDGFDMIECCRAFKTKEGNIFIRFPWRPPSDPSLECHVLLKPEAEHTYSMRVHNLPPTIPTEALVKKYLATPRHGAEGIRKFVAVVGQYTKAFYSRLQQMMFLESSTLLNGAAVNHNKGATILNFLVNPRLKNYPSIMAEFVLKYDPLDILPETVTAKPLCMNLKDKVPPKLQTSLDEVAERMKTTTFSVVLTELERQGQRVQAAVSPADPSQSSTEGQATPHAPTRTEQDSDEETMVPLFDIGE